MTVMSDYIDENLIEDEATKVPSNMDATNILLYSIAISLKKISDNTEEIKNMVNDGRFTQESAFNRLVNQ